MLIRARLLVGAEVVVAGWFEAGDGAAGDVPGCSSAFVAECGVGAAECVDAVVVAAVWDDGDFVEEGVGVGSGDEFGASVFCVGGNVARPDVFASGWSFASDVLAAENVSLDVLVRRMRTARSFRLDLESFLLRKNNASSRR